MSEFIEAESPEVGGLVIGLIKRVERYGAYLDLLEYPGWEGLVHVSEISLKWVRNIRDYLRENQREVFKVLRVDKASKQADVSLRRVTQKEREWKLLEWKRRQKVERVISLLAERSGKSIEELKTIIIEPARKQKISLYGVFVEALESGKLPEWMRLDEETANLLLKLINQEIKLRRAVLTGILTLTAPSGNGVEVIRKAIDQGLKAAGHGELVSITTIGSPRYMIRVEAEDEERAKELLESAASECIKIVQEAGGKGSLQVK
ncbi:MAG: S1 RNA-binding domain-containing protein [Nitrososphaeria archaeon]|nr:S1 RNA-binding domain-containing protein [Nitrososphaeria archaeon]